MGYKKTTDNTETKYFRELPLITKHCLPTKCLSCYLSKSFVSTHDSSKKPSFLGQKSCRTKVPRIFRFFVPNFAPNFAPNFPRIFREVFVLRFVGSGDQKKFTKNPRHFSMQNSQANRRKNPQKFSGERAK